MQHNDDVNKNNDKANDNKLNTELTLFKFKKTPTIKILERNFIAGKLITEADARAKITHESMVVKKKPEVQLSMTEVRLNLKYTYEWIAKKIEILVLLHELVGQEFLRLLLQSQPKTRFITNANEDTTYILSKAVKGFRPLSDKALVNALKDYYKTDRYNIALLAELLIFAVLLNEIDLKLGNLGTDYRNFTVKIDGDWLFAELRLLLSEKGRDRLKQVNFNIPDDILDRLPFPGTYEAWNWLDIIEENKFNVTSRVVDANMKNIPKYREGSNKALLKISIIPDELVYSFVKTYYEMARGFIDDALLDKHMQLTYNFIKTRKNTFTGLALNNHSFQKFIQRDVTLYVNGYADYVMKFKTTKKNILPVDNIKGKMLDQLNELKERTKLTVEDTQSTASTPSKKM
jgi:hypothetical protein